MLKKEEVLNFPSVAADTPKLVRSLEDRDCKIVDEVGAKAANLATLLQAGFPVPVGIVITTDAYARHMSDISLEEEGAAVRNMVISRQLDSDLLEELRQALCPYKDKPVAVRSSGVAEDLEGASFAGQYDTFLGLRGHEAVEEAIRKCWASAFSQHILQYRTAKQILSGHMAVLIQSLIEADAAGVAFTTNPVTGDRNETVVSAVRGLGERLVSGQASPDEWRVRGNEAIADSTPEQAIGAEQVLQVAELARRVEAYFGEPQDIEWAIKNGKLYLLQARPITTLNKDQGEQRVMIPVSVDSPAGYWEREESHYPDPISPATRSTFVPIVNDAFRQLCDEMSFLIEKLEQREIGGWIYQRTVPLGGKDRKAPPAWLMPLLIRIVPEMKLRIAGSVRAVQEDKAGQFMDQWHGEWKSSMIRRSKQMMAADFQNLSDKQLTQHLKDVRRYLKECMDRHMLLNGSIQLIIAEYAFACQDLLGWDEAKMMLMFSGLSEMSSAPTRALSKLAQFVRSQSKLAQDIDSEVPLSEMQRRYPVFAKKFEEYIHEFGCRAIRYELTFPTVAESPELLFRLLKDQLRGNYNPDEGMNILEQQRRSQLTEANAILKDRTEADRERFNKALARAMKAYPVREEHGFYDRDAPLALLRYAFLEAGRRFVNRGQLVKKDDVFFLEFEEGLIALSEGTAVLEIVKRRQGEQNWVLAHPGPASYGPVPSLPPSFASLPEEARFSANAVFWSLDQIFATHQSGQVQENADHIKGISASSGQYTGKVRVIRDESEFDHIERGDVLVCPITSPVWSMLFPSIGALVTDSGGILSHSAIIAREYRIPAVVATGNATELLKDGQIVTVDGDKGVVLSI